MAVGYSFIDEVTPEIASETLGDRQLGSGGYGGVKGFRATTQKRRVVDIVNKQMSTRLAKTTCLRSVSQELISPQNRKSTPPPDEKLGSTGEFGEW